MSLTYQISEETLNWLLDEHEPGVRYLTLRDLLDLPEDDANLDLAKQSAHKDGPISTILAAMDPEGFWVEPGPGYLPKYRSTVWSLIMLAQLGATIDQDARIEKACRYILNHALTDYGQFSASGTPGSTADCLQGNLCAAMLDLRFEDARLVGAFEWMARSVTGEGVAPMGDTSTPVRYYAGKCSPGFACGSNNKLPCAWGAVKVILAFSKLPNEQCTPIIKAAIQQGIDFLLGVDPATAAYPTGFSTKPSGNWWKFGFPVFYVTDILQIAEVLVRLGLGSDARLANALALIREKQDGKGRWPLEYGYTGKTWVDFGKKKQPNKWVTLRAAWVLQNC